MGYESRIIVVNVVKHPEEKIGKITYPAQTFVEEIASIKMSCMEQDFHMLFDKEIDYKIYTPGCGDRETNEDKYGRHIKSGDINKVIEWLEEKVKMDDYRRLKPLLGLLKGFSVEQWDKLEVLHYGY